MKNLSAFIWLGIGLMDLIFSFILSLEEYFIVGMIALGISTILFKIEEVSNRNK